MSKTLRVHVDDLGEVWCGQGGIRAFQTNLSPEEFVGRHVFRDADRLRVLGVPSNATFITLAYATLRKERSRQRRMRRFDLGSPNVAYRRLDNPEFVLQQMWQSETSAKVAGSWHRITERDFHTYLLLKSFQGAGPGELVRRVFREHCCYSAATFPMTADVDAAAQLVAEIVDPRWFLHHDRPNRDSKLLAYLGLNPRNFAAMQGIVPPDDTHRNTRRAALVLKAWSEGSVVGDRTHPRNFLWRIHDRSGGGPRGLLRASRAYVRFLRLVWLQALNSRRPDLFDPTAFFRDENEWSAYGHHTVEHKTV